MEVNKLKIGINMDTIYVKLSIPTLNEEVEEIRDEGLFFSAIANALCLDRDDVEEIDEYNYLTEIKTIKDKYSK